MEHLVIVLPSDSQTKYVKFVIAACIPVGLGSWSSLTNQNIQWKGEKARTRSSQGTVNQGYRKYSLRWEPLNRIMENI